MTTKDEVREGTEPRECGNCGNEDCELCHEPREEKCVNCGKTKKEHAICDKTGEYCCRPEDDSELYEAVLPGEEGGKEFWAKFDLNKWLEDAKEVGEILRKSEEAFKHGIIGPLNDVVALPKKGGLIERGLDNLEEIKKISPVEGEMPMGLPKNEGEDRKERILKAAAEAKKVIEAIEAREKEGECEYCGWPKSERNKWCLPCRNRKAEKEGEGWDWEREFTDTWPDTGDQGKIDFIRQHFLSRTAVEKMIEGFRDTTGIEFAEGPMDDESRAMKLAAIIKNKVVGDLLEKIKKQ